MPLSRNTRRQPASMTQVQNLIQSGAYDSAPLNPQGAQTMLDSGGNLGGRPQYGNASGSVQAAYQTDLPDNVYGPQLPDLYMSARNASRGQGRDDYAQELNRDQQLYDANMAIAGRRAGGTDPAIQWRPGTDGASFMGDQQAVQQAFTPQPEMAGAPTANGVTPDMIRLKLQERLRRSGS